MDTVYNYDTVENFFHNTEPTNVGSGLLIKAVSDLVTNT
jgi:hypothetical protein